MILSSDIQIVQKYWFSISRDGKKVFSDFYLELFETFPQYQQYFRNDIEVQSEKLSRMINIIINGVAVWDVIETEVKKLGQFHAAIDTFTAQDYQNISETLIAVMEKHKGYRDEAANQAWRNIFTLVSKTMLNASS